MNGKTRSIVIAIAAWIIFLAAPVAHSAIEAPVAHSANWSKAVNGVWFDCSVYDVGTDFFGQWRDFNLMYEFCSGHAHSAHYTCKNYGLGGTFNCVRTGVDGVTFTYICDDRHIPMAPGFDIQLWPGTAGAQQKVCEDGFNKGFKVNPLK